MLGGFRGMNLRQDAVLRAIESISKLALERRDEISDNDISVADS